MHILMAVMLLALQATALPPAPIPPDAAQSTSIAIARDESDRMTVGVRVGEHGPFAFLVDTGAERTVISRELAERLKLVAGKPVVLRSVLGSSLVPTVKIPALRTSGGQTRTGQKRAQRLSLADAPALPAEHIGADGILGVDSLAGQRVVFDFRARTMEVTPSRAAPARMDGITIVVEARRRDGRLLFTKATVDGFPVAVVVDTGGAISIGNSLLRERMARRQPTFYSAEIQTVLGEKMHAAIGSVHSLDIGGVTLKDLNIAFADAPIFRRLKIADRPALLLGMNAMRAFDRVSLDFATRKVRFVLPGTSDVVP
jgi:predicted aspartyl protease